MNSCDNEEKTARLLLKLISSASRRSELFWLGVQA
jgi:hypothetical protein